MSAFKKYLKSIPKQEAMSHVYECLRKGPTENMAWDLMDEVHGEEWTENKSIITLLSEVIEYLDNPIK